MDSLKVKPTEHTVLEASGSVHGPEQQSCVMQLSHIHRLHDSERNYDEHQHNLAMSILRNREGLAAPLKMSMELNEARKVGHLQFMPSSNLMADVLLNRDETVSFSDFLGIPEYSELVRQPHMVMEKNFGIL